MRIVTYVFCLLCGMMATGCSPAQENKTKNVQIVHDIKAYVTHARAIDENFAPPLHQIVLTNENPYSGVDVIVNRTLTYHILAAGQLILSSHLITSLSLRAQTSPCNVDIVSGENIPPQPKVSRESVLNYSAFDAAVVAQSGSVYYKSAGSTLRRSIDNGSTWSKSLVTVPSPDYFTEGTITSSGKVVVFTENGRMFQSDDGIHFHQIEENVFRNPPLQGPFWHGIDSNGNTIVFGEYGIDSHRSYRVFTSFDGGKSWSVTLSASNPSSIRHFHSVNYDRFNNTWYVTSGDTDTQVHWWTSKDAKTWTQVPGIGDSVNGAGTGQKYRTISLYFPNASTVMWGSDAAQGSPFCGIYRAPLLHPSDATLVTSLPHACYGLAGIGDFMVATCGIESGDSEKNAYIYVSTDGGMHWHSDFVWAMDPNRTPDAGFRSGLRGPDSLGRFYVQGIRLADEDGVNGLIFLPPNVSAH